MPRDEIKLKTVKVSIAPEDYRALAHYGVDHELDVAGVVRVAIDKFLVALDVDRAIERAKRSDEKKRVRRRK